MFLSGAAYGTVEGCFLKPVKGSTTPMIFRALQVIVSRAVLIGKYARQVAWKVLEAGRFGVTT